MKKIVLSITLLAIGFVTFAQQRLDCNYFVNNVEQLYRDGNYLALAQADSLLRNCNYSNEQKVLIYRYLVPTFAKLGFDSLASYYTQQLLKIQPFYSFNHQSDPVELNLYLNQFYTYPKITVGYIGGLDQIVVDRIRLYSILDSMNYDVPYTSRFGLASFAFVDYNFTKCLAIGMSFGLAYYNYKRSMWAYDFLIVDYLEKAAAYTWQMYFKYKLNFLTVKRFTPYVRMGGYVSYTPKFYAEVDVRVVNDTLHPDLTMPPRLERYLTLPPDSCQQWRYGATGGIGVQMSLQRMALFAEVAYSKEMVNYITPEGRYLADLIDGFYYVSDDFYLDKLFLTVGFSVNLNYKVAKKY